ncbi:hypothetical protein CN918_26670 [Priestia megaterium]|nr:hypothetical protein CN918_26670 [Priestia megaterium]
MRKRIIVGICVISVSFIFCIRPVSAHLVGAFQAFLSGVQDKDSEKELLKTMEKTKGQHEILKKKTKEKQAVFEKEQEKMLKTLTFYDTIAIDSYSSLLFNNENMVDILANEKIMKHKLSIDISQLEKLYTQYSEVNEALASVKGYASLLQAIKENKAKKQYLLDVYGSVTLYNDKQFASVLQAIWNQDMNKIDEYLKRDGNVLSDSLTNWIKENEKERQNYIGYEQINKKTKLTYLIQKDHVYITYKQGSGHVILISQFIQQSKSKPLYTLEIEAGYFNGYPLSLDIVKRLNEQFVFSYEKLQTAKQQRWIVQQVSNGLVFQPISTIMD